MALTVNSTVGQNKNGGTQTNTATVTRPASGVSAGDLILAFIATDRQTATITIEAVDAGWTQQIFKISTASSGQTLAVFSRTAAGGDPASWNFNLKDNGVSQTMAWVTSCVSISDSSTPTVDQKSGSEDTAGPTLVTASITPTANNAVVFSAVAQDQSDGATDDPTFAASSPAGLTELSDSSEETTNLGLAVYYETQTTAASTSHTISESGGTTSRGAATAILSVLPIAVSGSASLTITAGIVSAGTPTAFGASASTFTAGIVSAGSPTAYGVSSSTLTVGIASAGSGTASAARVTMTLLGLA